MKKKPNYSTQKRTTFLSLFLKSGITAMLCTLLFSNFFKIILENKVRDDIYTCMTDKTRLITAAISRAETEDKPEGYLSGYLSMYTGYYILFEHFPEFMYSNPNLYQINSESNSQENFAMSAIIDENGNTIASSRAKITAIFHFDEEGMDDGLYICDPKQLNNPEVNRFYDDYYALMRENPLNPDRYIIKSAYVNKHTHSFIPHEAEMQHFINNKSKQSVFLLETKQVNTQHISITLDDENFELVTFRSDGTNGEYPSAMLSGLHGTSWESFDNNQSRVLENTKFEKQGWYGDLEEYYCYLQTPVYIKGKQCTLNQYYHFSKNGTIIVFYYWIVTALFGSISVVLALLWAWQKNIRNTARYTFEDYQRSLTDHLAHDIKTPLMAISGYTENILNGKLNESEQAEYLAAILKNVAFTDALISRILYLNHMDKTNTVKSEELQLNVLVEDILSKYTLLLQKKMITYSVSGNVEIHAEKTSMDTIIENLISNAVKYTPVDGALKIEIDKKRLTVTNTVSEKVDTKELTHPFVRGDAARSNTEGNGLGLAIAERAALMNGFRLSVTCSNTEFRSEVRF